MPHASTNSPRAPAAIHRTIVAAWRALTGGPDLRDPDRPTLIACSGGVDSSALALALATTKARIVIAHILHDMRPEIDAAADRAAVAQLASRLGKEFVWDRANAAGHPGNMEANLRRARYAALTGLAQRSGCAFVATGHQADDQAETILMRLLRGTGPRGLRGIHPRRVLAGGITLVRPMLRVARVEAAAVCAAASWEPVIDPTNNDLSRLRAAVRAQVLPALVAARPTVLRTLGRVGAWHAELTRVLDALATETLDRGEATDAGWRWPVAALSGVSPILIADLTAHISRDRGREEPADLSWRTITDVAQRIQRQAGGWRVDVGAVRWAQGPTDGYITASVFDPS